MYKAGANKGKKKAKGKDVRDSKGHVHNKFHVLVIASKHPPESAEEPENG
jgi:hypothetical protein